LIGFPIQRTNQSMEENRHQFFIDLKG
jgi:hypothetical protein